MLRAWSKDIQSVEFEKMMQKMGVPVVYLALDNLSNYPDIFSFLGRLFKEEDRAAVLTGYSRDSLSEIRKVVTGIPLNKRRLCPKRYNIDIVKETRRFYKLFLGVDLTTEEAESIIQGR